MKRRVMKASHGILRNHFGKLPGLKGKLRRNGKLLPFSPPASRFKNVKDTLKGILRALLQLPSALFQGSTAASSMKSQLILILTGLSIVPLLFLGTITFLKAQEALGNAQKSALLAHAQGLRHNLDAVLGGVDDTLKGIASQTNVLILMEDVNQDGTVNDTSLLNSTAFSLKNAVKGSDKLYESAFIAGKNGQVVVESATEQATLLGTYINETDYYRKISAQKDFVIGAPFLSKASGRLVVPTARSIETLAGRSGTLVVLFDHKRFMNFLADSGIGDSGAVYIMDANGSTVFHPDPAKLLLPMTAKLFGAASEEKNDASLTGFSRYHDETGPRLAAWETQQDSGWTIVTTLSRKEFEEGILQIRNFMLVIVLLSVTVASLTAVRYTESLTRPIQELGQLMNRVARGELEGGSTRRPNREVAHLNDSFNEMVTNLKRLTRGISEAGSSVSSASEVLGALSAQTASAAENMLVSVDEIAAGATAQSDEAAQSVLRSQVMADAIREVHVLTDSILTAARSSEKLTQAGIAQISALNVRSFESQQASAEIAREVGALNSEIQRIDGIAEGISKLAKTTNLLALNAAIEAARAGDAGLGFTIVAQEVRKLADQTAQESAAIRSILLEIQKKSHSMKAVVQRNEQAVTAQDLMVRSTEEAFNHIAAQTDATAAQAAFIAEAVQALNRSKEEMLQSVSAISAVASKTAQTAQQARAATQEQFCAVEQLLSQAEDMHQLAGALTASTEAFKPGPMTEAVESSRKVSVS